MSNRGHNEGSIYRREDGLWVGVLSLGYVGGKRKRKYFYGETRKEVDKKLTAAKRDQQQGLLVVTERQTIESFLLMWLEQVVRQKPSLNTYTSYKNIVVNHLIPEVGRVQLAKLTPQEVQVMLNRKRDSGLSPRMVQYIHAVLRIALGRAVKWGYIAQNVAKLVDVPGVPKYEPEFLAPEEARQLLRVVQGHRLSALFTVALALGLRKGEALGLRWKDVDFEKAQVTVRKNLQFIEKKFHMQDTKSAQGRRTFSVPDVAMQALLKHQARQQAEREKAGDAWQEHGLVFTSSIGTPIHASNVNRMFNRLLAQAGMLHIRFHDLRHTCGSLLIAQGVHPRVVMEILGHSQISLTMNTYGHLIPGLKEEVADKLQELLSEDEGKE